MSSNPAEPDRWGRAFLFAPSHFVRIHPGSRRHGSTPCRGAICLTGSLSVRVVETIRAIRTRTWWPNRGCGQSVRNRVADVTEAGAPTFERSRPDPRTEGFGGPMTSRVARIGPLGVPRAMHAQRRPPDNRKEAAAEKVRLEPPFVRGGSDGIRTRGLGLDRAAC